MSEYGTKDYGVVVWAALRGIQALSESVAMTLDEPAVGETALGQGGPILWLHNQGMDEEATAHEIAGSEDIRAAHVMRDYVRKHLGESWLEAELASRRSQYDYDDFGYVRSGAGWTRLPNFIITSGFVRLLGAIEQFEIDVLKALFEYRPLGKPPGPPEERMMQGVEVDVVKEVPQGRKFLRPVLWTWLQEHAKDNGDRKNIFKDVFGIDVVPPGYSSGKRDEWYKKRHAIVHGRDEVIMSLSEFCDVEVYLKRFVLSVGSQCQEKLWVMI